jgi:hypothetical protein
VLLVCSRLRASVLREQLQETRLRASVLREQLQETRLRASVLREQPEETQPPYSGPMNPRVRRLIVSGVLGSLVLIVVLTAAWNWLR